MATSVDPRNMEFGDGPTNTVAPIQAPPSMVDGWLARFSTINWELVAYVVIFALAIFSRFYDLGARTMSHDESLHTVYSHNLYDRGFFQHSPLMHGPILFHATALMYTLFGANDFSARIYAALLGVLIVMFPLLLRRWLGRTGAVLASVMLLVSPLMLYYSRYIRHDMPSIFSALLMFWAAMMYISGPEKQQRRAYWLYIIAAAMIWNLGSKETAFIYVAIFGLFLTLYWLVRVVQHIYGVHGRPLFDMLIVSLGLAVVAALAMIVVVSITLVTYDTLGSRLDFLAEQVRMGLSGEAISVDFSTFLAWTGLIFVLLLAVIIAPALWVYRHMGARPTLWDALVALIVIFSVVFFWTALDSAQVMNDFGELQTVSTAAASFAVGGIVAVSLALIYAANRIDGTRNFRTQVLALLIIALVVCVGLIIVEEVSHVPSRGDSPVVAAVPDEISVGETPTTDYTLAPLALVWGIGLLVVIGIGYSKLRGWWKFFDHFPEFDVLLVMGSLILPWLTAIFIVATHADAENWITIGEGLGWMQDILPLSGPQQTGRFVIGFLAWAPLMAISIAAGLAWNWRRWLIASLIFHGIFAVFFTTVFTNIEGLATGMVYSLEYWLEQQGERRGSQPQYYYLLIIMPVYEFLPIIGSVLAMVAGMVMFWRRRKDYDVDTAPPAIDETTINDHPVVEVPVLVPDAVSDEEILAQALDIPPEKTPVSAVERDREIASRWRLERVPFLLFVAFWAVVNLFGYTLAGEKMPWLGTHLTVPMIFLSAWYFGRVLDRLNLRTFLRRGWLMMALLPFLFMVVFRLISPYLVGQRPFQGVKEVQLEWTYQWLGILLVGIVLIVTLARLIRQINWPHFRHVTALTAVVVLVIMTGRVAGMASFVNYDMATEYLVYAHAAPANKEVTERLAELSQNLTGGNNLRVLYDNKFSWPGSWYLRDFENKLYYADNTPTLQQLDNAVAVIVGDINRSKVEPLVEENFQRIDQMRLWWPMQDYFGLSATRLNDLFWLEDASAGERRLGIFDIWWGRDYTAYGEAVGRSFAQTNWPVSNGMTFYLRNDIAAQLWPLGIGDSTTETVFAAPESNQCALNWRPLTANAVFDTPGQGLLRPLGVTVAADGRVYVAEEGAHRVSVFTADGTFIESFGQEGIAADEGAFFERPHSVAIAENGDMFVVDTWNYLIRRFDVDGNALNSWGQAITAGFDAQLQPTDGFWGPRDIAIDGEGRIYVSDTGNKRVRVYQPDGTFLRDIGYGGTGAGQLNEPAGIEIAGDRLYVADTWNRRIAIFDLDGVHIKNVRISAWFDELGNRPYIAADETRNLLYVTDPDAGRILVFDLEGECIGSFGQHVDQDPGLGQFITVGGIAVGPDGEVYITDLDASRIVRYRPFVDITSDESDQGVEVPANNGNVSGDENLEITEETTPEM